MRKILISVICFLIILTSQIFAADWYVRPAGGSYGSENGTSYSSAWDGLLNIVWGEAGVQPGDTLWVCGLHVHNVTNKGYIATQADITPISGTGESARITIRGDYPGDPGIVWGAYRMIYESWIYEGNNVWSITLPGNSYQDWFFENITVDSWIVFDKESTLAEVQANPGSHYSANYTGGTKLYVQCSDSGNPTGRIYANRWGYHWKLNGKEYITFLNLKMYNPYRFIRVDGGESHSHIKLDGCTLWYGEGILLRLGNGCNYNEIVNCDIAWAENGIYTTSTTNSAPSYYLFKGNTIHDMGIRIVDSDAHAIGIQGGHDGIIEDNYMYNCGTGVTLYAFTNQELKNTIVRRNIVRDTHTYGGANSRGIETACNNDSLSDKTGNQFYQNIVINADIGYRFQWEDEQEVYNNIACNCGIGLFSGRNYKNYGGNIRARNNIFYNSRIYHVYYSTKASISVLDFDYNIYYPDRKKIFKYNSRERNFKRWRSFKKGNYSFDKNSSIGNPLFIDPEKYDFHLQPDSPAIDAGVNVGLRYDFEGNLIPQRSSPDLGVYEYFKKI